MPIFGEASTPFDEIVEKVTAETLTSENWALMMDICDDVAVKGPKACKLCLTSVKKRINHRDPHVVLLALSLLDCLWNNCGAAFRREVSSKEFINELQYKATSSNRVIGEKTRELIKKWNDNECKKDSSLSLVEFLYKSLLEDGYTFETSSTSSRKKITFSNDPNVVATEEEEADIAKAIALSLSEASEKNKKQPPQNMYPVSLDNFNQNSSHPNPTVGTNQRQVKALYDFEAAEDNELSFSAGDLILVLDDSDQNWWRGSTEKASGLFPASFVTSDLNEKVIDGRDLSKQGQQRAEQQELPKVEIDEEILLKCIQLLQDCDPTGEAPDSPELAYFEQMSLAQAALIDQKLAQIDKQHNMLAKTDVNIRDVLASYDNAVQQMQNAYLPNMPMINGGAPMPLNLSGVYGVPPSTPLQQQHRQMQQSQPQQQQIHSMTTGVQSSVQQPVSQQQQQPSASYAPTIHHQTPTLNTTISPSSSSMAVSAPGISSSSAGMFTMASAGPSAFAAPFQNNIPPTSTAAAANNGGAFADPSASMMMPMMDGFHPQHHSQTPLNNYPQQSMMAPLAADMQNHQQQFIRQ